MAVDFNVEGIFLRQELANQSNPRLRLFEIDGRVLFSVYNTDGEISERQIFYLLSQVYIREGVEIDVLAFQNMSPTERIIYLRQRMRVAIQKIERDLNIIENARFRYDPDGGDVGRENRGCPWCGRPNEESASAVSDPSGGKVARTSADDTEQAAQRPEGSLPPE